MSLNESIVEDAALEWSGEQSRVAPTHIPAFSHGKKEKREAIRRLNAANAYSNPHPASPTGRGEEASVCALCTDRRAILANSATVQTRMEMTP